MSAMSTSRQRTPRAAQESHRPCRGERPLRRHLAPPILDDAAAQALARDLPADEVTGHREVFAADRAVTAAVVVATPTGRHLVRVRCADSATAIVVCDEVAFDFGLSQCKPFAAAAGHELQF